MRQAGFDVLTAAEANTLEKSDAVQLAHAIGEQRVLITGNHDDFEDLHDLVLIAGGHHTGILIVRRDNDPTRDLSLRGIARAVENVLRVMPDLRDEFQVLNHWR